VEKIAAGVSKDALPENADEDEQAKLKQTFSASRGARRARDEHAQAAGDKVARH